MIPASRVFIRPPTEADCLALLALHRRSQAFYFPWVSPPLNPAGCREYLVRCQGQDFEGLLICSTTSQQIVGVANLSQIFYKAFQNAYLSYYVDVGFAGQGLMAEGVSLAISHAFYTLGLHRLEANIQPENKPSIHLAKRLGFTQEGFSKRYLKINGEWRDHERWALTAEDWK